MNRIDAAAATAANGGSCCSLASAREQLPQHQQQCCIRRIGRSSDIHRRGICVGSANHRSLPSIVDITDQLPQPPACIDGSTPEDRLWSVRYLFNPSQSTDQMDAVRIRGANNILRRNKLYHLKPNYTKCDLLMHRLYKTRNIIEGVYFLVINDSKIIANKA